MWLSLERDYSYVTRLSLEPDYMLRDQVGNEAICYVVKFGTRLYVTWLSLEPGYMLCG